MHSTVKSIAVLLLIIIAFACTKEQSAEQAVQQSLDDFRRLVSEQNYRELGFTSLGDLAKMSLGVPIPVYYVGLSDLKQFKAGDDPNKLLVDAHEMIYPIRANEQLRSSVGVKKRGKEWEVASFGRPKLTRALARIREDHAASSSLSQSNYFAVEIPSMYLIFIGHHVGDKLMLTHVHDHDEFDFEAGETELAADLIAKIVDAAREYKGALSSAH